MADTTAAHMQARVDLAACHRLAVHFGYNEGIDNHITLMMPGHDDRFLLAPFGLHWSEIKASDFLVVGLDGSVISGSGPVEDTAFYIHAPLHAARPDLRCVMHSHTPYATALSMLEEPTLVIASQNAIGFHDCVAWDCAYNGFALDRAEGERMAEVLGDKAVLLLRNHGLVTTGPSVAEAFNAHYFFERAAMTQLIAQASGQPLRPVDPAVVADTLAQYRASEEVDDANIGIIPGMGNRDDARMKGFEAGVANAHHCERFRHPGSNALFVIPVHRRTIAANLPHSRPEPLLLRTCSARATGLPRY